MITSWVPRFSQSELVPPAGSPLACSLFSCTAVTQRTRRSLGSGCLMLPQHNLLVRCGSGSGPALKFVPKFQNRLPATRVRGAAKASACTCQGPCGAPAGVVLPMVVNWGSYRVAASSHSAGTRERKNGFVDAVFKSVKYGVAR